MFAEFRKCVLISPWRRKRAPPDERLASGGGDAGSWAEAGAASSERPATKPARPRRMTPGAMLVSVRRMKSTFLSGVAEVNALSAGRGGSGANFTGMRAIRSLPSHGHPHQGPVEVLGVGRPL